MFVNQFSMTIAVFNARACAQLIYSFDKITENSYRSCLTLCQQSRKQSGLIIFFEIKVFFRCNEYDVSGHGLN